MGAAEEEEGSPNDERRRCIDSGLCDERRAGDGGRTLLPLLPLSTEGRAGRRVGDKDERGACRIGFSCMSVAGSFNDVAVVPKKLLRRFTAATAAAAAEDEGLAADASSASSLLSSSSKPNQARNEADCRVPRGGGERPPPLLPSSPTEKRPEVDAREAKSNSNELRSKFLPLLLRRLVAPIDVRCEGTGDADDAAAAVRVRRGAFASKIGLTLTFSSSTGCPMLLSLLLLPSLSRELLRCQER